MTCDVEQLFTGFFTSRVSSSVRSLLRLLAHFKIEVFVFLWLLLKPLLYISDNGLLSNASFANISSESVAYLLTLSVLLCLSQKSFKFHRSSTYLLFPS